MSCYSELKLCSKGITCNSAQIAAYIQCEDELHYADIIYGLLLKPIQIVWVKSSGNHFPVIHSPNKLIVPCNISLK